MGFSRQEYWSELPFPSPLKPSNQSKNIYIEFHKIKTFCSSKDTTRQPPKRQHAEWEEKFVNHTSDNGLILRIYKELLQLKNKKKNSNFKNKQRS